jgi:hypothetical protein
MAAAPGGVVHVSLHQYSEAVALDPLPNDADDVVELLSAEAPIPVWLDAAKDFSRYVRVIVGLQCYFTARANPSLSCLSCPWCHPIQVQSCEAVLNEAISPDAMHDALGHGGVNQTLACLRQSFHWSGMPAESWYVCACV